MNIFDQPSSKYPGHDMYFQMTQDTMRYMTTLVFDLFPGSFAETVMQLLNEPDFNRHEIPSAIRDPSIVAASAGIASALRAFAGAGGVDEYDLLVEQFKRELDFACNSVRQSYGRRKK